jgi:uncharacterized protein
MKLRSITLGINGRREPDAALEMKIKRFLRESNNLFSQEGFGVRTQRIALSPFSANSIADSRSVHATVDYIASLCRNMGVRWFCVPFMAFGEEIAEINAVALKIVQEHKNAFINYMVTLNEQLDLRGVRHASSFIHNVSQLTENGFDNFRCGVSFNCKPDGPFFPFTYHSGSDGFSIALELVPLLLEVIKRNQGKSLPDIRGAILAEIMPAVIRVNEICQRIEQLTGVEFIGIDSSLAPHPEQPDHSVAYLIELLGVRRFGCNGTTFITSFFTDIIKSLVKQSSIRSTGFNGVMFSVLEDQRLGEISSDSDSFTIDSLLAFSTVCGCGIDMVPVPGNVCEAEIASLMLDVAAVALRLNKPLGVRVLPIPGKNAGETTDFNHDFLHNTKIKSVREHTCSADFFTAAQPFSYMTK